MSAPTPDISVVVPTHNRSLRLRWLLNALEEQTLPRDRFEVIVAHGANGQATEDVLRTHPLAEAGVLRHLALSAPSAPGRNRNAGWKAAEAPLIAFTDDDCRPPPEWLERALETAGRNPGAIVQGATQPDPDEIDIANHAPWIRSQWVTPPQPWAQACNIVYPRAVLEACGGFPEGYWGGEDTALAETARSQGVPYVGAPDLLTYHAVEEDLLPKMVRVQLRWHHLPHLLKRHPSLRREFFLGLFYRREHFFLMLAALGWALMRRSRLASLLIVPYVADRFPPQYPSNLRGRLRGAIEMPGHALLDAAEIAGLAYGSVRHRSPLL